MAGTLNGKHAAEQARDSNILGRGARTEGRVLFTGLQGAQFGV